MYNSVKESVSKLDEVVPLIAKVVDGGDLSVVQAQEVFTKIFLYDSLGYHFIAFITALHAKGETSDELLGLCLTHKNLGVRLSPRVDFKRVTDLSGTGAGKIKTFNVSTAASFIVAAAGYTVAKNAYYGVTSPTGSADIFKTFGVDIAGLSIRQIEETLETVGICPVYLPFISPKLQSRGRLSKKALVSSGIRIRTPFHLATHVYNPLPIKRRIYGCYSEKYLEVIGELFAKLGYLRTLTFYGDPGMPEISNLGKTVFVEQVERKLKKYLITPRDLGVKTTTEKQINTKGKEQNIADFLRVLTGKEKGPKSDLVAINAAASLYVMGESKTIAEAVPKAKEIIKSGEGFKVLERLVDLQGEPKLLRRWMNNLAIFQSKT